MMDAPSGYRVEQALSAWHSARSRLLTEDADLAHDEAALSELLGSEEGDVRDVLARLLRAACMATLMANSAGEMANEIKARQDRYKRRADSMRGTAFAIMDALGERRLELPDLTASIRAGTPSVIITDEAALPAEYIRITKAPDKAAILADLKQGVVVEGAQLSNGIPSLAVRTK